MHFFIFLRLFGSDFFSNSLWPILHRTPPFLHRFFYQDRLAHPLTSTTIIEYFLILFYSGGSGGSVLFWRCRILFFFGYAEFFSIMAVPPEQNRTVIIEQNSHYKTEPTSQNKTIIIKQNHHHRTEPILSLYKLNKKHCSRLESFSWMLISE